MQLYSVLHWGVLCDVQWCKMSPWETLGFCSVKLSQSDSRYNSCKIFPRVTLGTIPHFTLTSAPLDIADIFRAFVALVRTKIDMFCKLSERRMRTRECERVIAAQSLGARLAHGYTASKCPSRYPVMKRSRSYRQTVTWTLLPEGEAKFTAIHVALRHCRAP